MDPSSIDSLVQPNGNADISSQIGQQIGDIVTFATIVSLILTFVIVVLWIMSWMHRRKVQNAILDIQKTLHEINECDKARATPEAVVDTTPAPQISAEPDGDEELTSVDQR